MKRTSRKIWLFFAGSAVAVCLGMAWLSATTLRLERAEAAAQELADYHARLRLALWRIDSIVAPILAREASRPYFEYSPFYVPHRAYDRNWAQLEPGQVLVPSPLQRQPVDWITLHFQISPDGRWSSPRPRSTSCGGR